MFEPERYTADYWLNIASSYEIAAVCGVWPTNVYVWRKRGVPEYMARLLSIYYGVTSLADFENVVEENKEKISAKARAYARERKRRIKSENQSIS
jgi:hypothetical protein